MNIGVISDIHSNYHGLKACVDHAILQGADRFLFLGDYVSDCAYPQKTMKLLYELKDSYECSFIKGNREEYMLDHRDCIGAGWVMPSSATGSLLYTYEYYQGNAQFGILHGERGTWQEELLQIEYDKNQAAFELHESGLFESASIWARIVEICLLTGVDHSKECLELALFKYREREGKKEWTTLPEVYWQEAAAELGI